MFKESKNITLHVGRNVITTKFTFCENKAIFSIRNLTFPIYVIQFLKVQQMYSYSRWSNLTEFIIDTGQRWLMNHSITFFYHSYLEVILHITQSNIDVLYLLITDDGQWLSMNSRFHERLWIYWMVNLRGHWSPVGSESDFSRRYASPASVLISTHNSMQNYTASTLYLMLNVYPLIVRMMYHLNSIIVKYWNLSIYT